MPGGTGLRLSDASVICRVIYFQFLVQSAFLPCRKQAVVSFGRSVIIAGLWRLEVARPGNFVSNFCVFKRPLTLKFSKFCFRRFHRLADRRCSVQIS